ncbi:hypothetical protein GCM10023221_05940 [Luteimicrobium xylanilyticum]|uniref:Uncharacterized protein n=1 Tax=Luteimicrobium xylanilyticum TaxID=1133546 RepID=A0A5P9QBC4_9MICO|nr:hypothetical protein [Luteimicrobium xylanilyticum]QFU98420.1 hypothetical protein KDY119_01936 [Luteimicrobium xylanilyticum]
MSTERTAARATTPQRGTATRGTLATDDDGRLSSERRRELLAGGDASRAPQSLSAMELHPIEGDSSGTSWDDPDEL